MPTPQTRVEQVLHLLESSSAAEYFGEPVTQLEHALQCAELARQANADEETIIAALLHDIGHLLKDGDETGVPDHDTIGSDYLHELGFSEKVVELVAGHVEAKRYLTATRQDYALQLSDASRRTLRLQGGPMTQHEVRRFEADPLFREKLRIRSWDEQAKRPGAYTRPLVDYKIMLKGHLIKVRS